MRNFSLLYTNLCLMKMIVWVKFSDGLKVSAFTFYPYYTGRNRWTPYYHSNYIIRLVFGPSNPKSYWYTRIKNYTV